MPGFLDKLLGRTRARAPDDVKAQAGPAAPDGGPVDEAAYADLCIQRFQQGDATGAQDVARRGIAAFPASARLRAFLGNLLAMGGDFAGASESYRDALTAGDQSAEVRFNYGVALGKLGRRDDALEQYRQALALDPALAGAHLNSASLLQQAGRPREALAHCERAIAIAPDYVEAHVAAANAHQASGDGDRALAAYERARALRPGDAGIHSAIGTILLARDRHAEAIASYREALRLQPDDVGANLGLGNAMLQRGDKAQAVERFREVLRLDPANGVAHLVAALTDTVPDRASDAYVAKLFDDYAGKFDDHLVKVLRYDIPAEIARAIAPLAAGSRDRWDVLDLGCGTGLVAAAIAPLARSFVGVDLSPGMLAKARDGGNYGRLECSDLLDMLRGERAASYDLVTAADVFVYVGRLDDIVRETGRVLRRGGLFAFSVESLDAPRRRGRADDDARGYALDVTGRYAHARDYLASLATANGFEVVACDDARIRVDKGVPVDGYLAVWRLGTSSR